MGSDESIGESSEGDRPFTVQGDGLPARTENALSLPPEIYRSSSAASPSKLNSPQNFPVPVPPHNSNGNDKNSSWQNSRLYKNSNENKVASPVRRKNSTENIYPTRIRRSPTQEESTGWATVRNNNIFTESENAIYIGMNNGMTRMASSPLSVGLEIYDDDDDSILVSLFMKKNSLCTYIYAHMLLTNIYILL